MSVFSQSYVVKFEMQPVANSYLDALLLQSEEIYQILYNRESREHHYLVETEEEILSELQSCVFLSSVRQLSSVQGINVKAPKGWEADRGESPEGKRGITGPPLRPKAREAKGGVGGTALTQDGRETH